MYPFVRTPEWYLLPKEERGGMLAEHGIMGREFPDVLANTTSAFGLGDWEWILCFEADEADRLVDCIRRLRDAQRPDVHEGGGPLRDRDPQARRRGAGRPDVGSSSEAVPPREPG